MKVLSIRQPWAYCVVQGAKDVENRTWATDYRGPVLIHASKTPAARDALVDFIHKAMKESDINPAELERGGIVGMAVLADCVTKSASDWFFGPYGFVLADPRPLPFYPCPGRLGLFNPSPALVRWLREQLRKETK